MPKPSKSQLEAMRKCGFSEEEIADIVKCDDAIDHGERMPFDLTPEQEKAAKKFVNAETRKAPTVYELDNTNGKRNRKENATKASIIAEIATFLTEKAEILCENVEITNKERVIAFKCGDNQFEITLTQKRKPKN